MTDYEDSPPKEIEIDADGECGETKSPSSERETNKANGDKSESEPRKSRSRSHSSSRSRSRSQSRHRHRRSRKRRSRSYSRSRSPQNSRRYRRYGRRDSDYDRYDRRNHSRSPMSSRKRHAGDRDNPEPNRCIGVFGLSLYTEERRLRDVFGRYGQINQVQVVYDRQTGRSRGFGFVYFKSTDDAFEAKDRCDGIEIDGRKIRVDFSVTKRAHTPTPGIYLGRQSDTWSSSRRSPNRRYSSYRRSRSPYTYGYRRSASYSPPRKYY